MVFLLSQVGLKFIMLNWNEQISWFSPTKQKPTTRCWKCQYPGPDMTPKSPLYLQQDIEPGHDIQDKSVCPEPSGLIFNRKSQIAWIALQIIVAFVFKFGWKACWLKKAYAQAIIFILREIWQFWFKNMWGIIRDHQGRMVSISAMWAVRVKDITFCWTCIFLLNTNWHFGYVRRKSNRICLLGFSIQWTDSTGIQRLWFSLSSLSLDQLFSEWMNL